MKTRNVLTASVLALLLTATGCGKADMADAADLLTEVKTTQFFSGEKVTEADMEIILAAGVNAPSAMNTQPWHFTAVTDAATIEKLAGMGGGMMIPSDFGGSGSMPEGMPDMSGNMPEGMPNMPEGMPNMPEGMPNMPEGMPNMPEGMPNMPEGMPNMPEGMPNMPEGMPNMPGDGQSNFLQSAKKAGLGDAPLTIVVSCEAGAELSAGLAVQNMSAAAQLLGYGTKILTSPTMTLNSDEAKALLKIPENQQVAAVLLVGKAASAEETPDAVASATARNAFDQVVTVID